MRRYRARVSFRRVAAHALESGRWDGLLARALASAWAPIADRGLVRPGIVPAEISVVCVGGATLGGSGKTRVAMACAHALASTGAHVVFVGHAYRAAPRGARTVSVCDALEYVGDEALVCARALEASGVPVVVGPTRQAAMDYAVALGPDVLVLDGPLRVRGRTHGHLSLLAVDANRPWGSGRLPPSGDLKASRDVLLAHADYVVPVDALPSRVRWPNGERGSLSSLRTLSDGASRGRGLALYTAIARPDRLVRALAGVGVRPRTIVSRPDHGSRLLGSRDRWLPRSRWMVDVDAWIATEKCALHLGASALRAPLGVLEADLALPHHVERALAGLSSRGRLLPEPQARPFEAPRTAEHE